MERWIEFGARSNNGFFTRNHKIYNNNDLIFLINKYNNIDCYTSIYSYDTDNQSDSHLLGDYYIDFDSPLSSNKEYEQLINEVKMAINFLIYEMKIDQSNILLFYSGAKGFHLIVPHQIFNVSPCKYLNIIYKELTQKIILSGGLKYCDLRIYDNRRLFRLPNSINSKTGLYKINITLDELENKSLHEIQSLSTKPRDIISNNFIFNKQTQNIFNVFKNNIINNLNNKKPKEKKTEFKKPDQLYIPYCIEHIMNNGAPEGTRNNSLAFLSSYFLQNGYTYEETYDILDMWNKSFNDIEIEEKEFEATLKSIFNNKHTYGCQMAKIISICNKKCKYYNNKNNKNFY